MAVSRFELHDLLGPIDNDNAPLPSEIRRSATVTQFPFGNELDRFNLDLPNIKTELEEDTGILWARLKHQTRACYTPELMQDMRDLQNYLKERLKGYSADNMPFKVLAWTSCSDKVWSLGGDLTNFTRMIRAGDEAGLRAYAHLAIDILFDNYRCLDLPILTAAVVNGDAIGGGFEAMLTDDIVIAEEHAKFGLPEILFNLFPGMGAYSFLKRKVGGAAARTLIEDGKSRSPSEMVELGLADKVVASGEGEAALRDWIQAQDNRFQTTRTLRQVQRRIDPVTKSELVDIVDMWTDLAMQLTADDLRRMDCLARVQSKKRVAAPKLALASA